MNEGCITSDHRSITYRDTKTCFYNICCTLDAIAPSWLLVSGAPYNLRASHLHSGERITQSELWQSVMWLSHLGACHGNSANCEELDLHLECAVKLGFTPTN
ncbi:hypothetical protein F2P79_004518 [Pimephales promelas]|nr:hypothetical protein F2P79_004518 [Pimephales promelas]